jgi:hypothetical protein
MTKTVTDWLHEGEQLFGVGLEEYRVLDEQIAGLESRRTQKRVELEEMAKLLGRKAPELPHGGESRDGHRVTTRHAPVATTLGGRK